MIDYSREIGLDFDLYSSTRFFAERETRATDIRRDFFKITATIVDFEDIWRTERIIKGTLVVATEEEKARAAEFVRRFEGVLSFSWSSTPAYPDTDFINIISPKSSKGKALEELASFLGIDLKDVMAIGDGANDIPLLSTAGFGIAMGNAPEKVKEIADYVTLDVDNGGIAAAVNKFLL
jgi:Cof subfamily protein (haloacid dehalogenase superfamily)